MKKSISVLLLIVLLMLCTTPAQAGLGADSEYFLNLSIDGTELFIANHFNSSTEGNWIDLQGGDSFIIPSPLSFSFEGINSSAIDLGGKDVDLEFSVLNNTRYTVAYPYDSHRYYTTSTGHDEVSFLFNGSTYFAGVDVDVHLFNSSDNSLRSAIDGITTGNSSAVDGLLNSSLQMSEKTLDSNGDMSASFGTLGPGQYVLMVIYVDDTAGTNTLLGVTLFEVVTYDCDVTTDLDGTNATIEVDLIDAPSGNYTYDTVMLAESAYPTDVLMEFNGSRESLDLLINNIIFVDGLNIPNGSIYDVNQSFVRNRLTGMYGASNVSIQHTTAGNSAIFNIDTSNLTLSNYLVLTTVSQNGQHVAFNQAELDLVIHDIDLDVNTTYQEVEPSQTATYLVTIENNGNVEESLTLTTTSPSGVNADLNSTSVTLGPGNLTRVTLNVSSDTIGDSHPVTVKATGTDTSDSIKTYTTVLDPLTVTVDSIHKLTLTDQNASYLLTIANSGNQAHTFNISVTSTANTFLNLSNVTLNAGESQDVLLNVSSPVEGLFTTQVTVNNSQDTDTLSLLTNVGTSPVHSIELTSNTRSLSVEPGTPASYLLTLENTGNVNETVNLSLTASPSVTANLNTTSQTIAPGNTANILLNVTGTSVGGPYSVTVEANSGSTSDSVQTRTTFLNPLEVDVDANRKTVMTGQNVSYLLTLTNTGTIPHTFNISSTCDTADLLSNSSLTLGPGNSAIVTYSINTSTAGIYDSVITLGDTYISRNLSLSTQVDNRPVYGVSLFSNTSTQSVNTGVNATYELTILNTGNVNDSYDLILRNPGADLAILNDSSTIYLPAGQQATRLLNVSSASGGTCDVTLTASSLNSSRTSATTTSTHVSSHGVILDADTCLATTTDNTTTTVTLRLKNTGNVADNFTLTSRSTNNTVSMPSELTNVASGETREFKVTLFSADVGSSVSTIKATSQGDTTKKASQALTLVVNPSPVYGVCVNVRDPVAAIEQNDDLTYQVNVRNTGNVNDTYTLISTADLSATTLSLLPGQTGTLLMNITGLSTPGSYIIPVTVTSQTQTTASSISYAHIDVHRVASVAVTPGSRTIKGSDPSVYDIKITNTGTQTHSYRLSKLAQSASTTLTISPAIIYDLEVGESAHAEVVFNNTNASDRRIAANLRVSDLNDPLKNTRFDINTLYLTADVHGVDIRSDVLSQSINSGNDGTYALTVFNPGNVNETFTLGASRGQLSTSTVSLGPGESESVTFTDSPTSTGDHISRIVAASGNASDSLKVNTRVREVQEEFILNSQIDDLSSITNSNLTSTTVINSLITDSTIADSHIEDSSIDNSTVLDSDMEDILLSDAYVEENIIYNGTIILDEVRYNILKSRYPEGVTIDGLLQGKDSFDSSIVATPGDKTGIEATDSNVSLQLSTNESFVGGSLNIVKTGSVSENITSPTFSTAGSFLTFEESENIEQAMSSVVIGFYYDEADLGDLSEDELYMYWYDSANDTWVALEGPGTPAFCLGAGRNTTSNYVWANVTHFSTYTLGVPVSDGGTVGSGGSGGSGSAGSSGEAYENIELRNALSKQLYMNSKAVYEFTDEVNPIKAVNFIPLYNAGSKTVVIEVLKDTSSLVDEVAPGNVYKNVNIWVGTASWANEDTVKDASIDFEVPAFWLEDNSIDSQDIRLYIYNDGWVELDTTMTGENSNTYLYNAITSEFSSFAIVGLTGDLVEEGDVIASFKATPVSGVAPLEVTFKDTSINASSLMWDFGDGETSLQQHPIHTYSKPGEYTVTLTASNGYVQDTMDMTIKVSGQTGDAGISGTTVLVGVIIVIALIAAGFYLYNRKEV
jgi:methanogen extracellular protein (TIGR04279 family)/PGF-pre-PGF domain-containing protein/uncharacterized repeat protein (TIGR01451 family)